MATLKKLMHLNLQKKTLAIYKYDTYCIQPVRVSCWPNAIPGLHRLCCLLMYMWTMFFFFFTFLCAVSSSQFLLSKICCILKIYTFILIRIEGNPSWKHALINWELAHNRWLYKKNSLTRIFQKEEGMCLKKKKRAVFYWDQLFFVGWVDQLRTQTLLMHTGTIICVTSTILSFSLALLTTDAVHDSNCWRSLWQLLATAFQRQPAWKVFYWKSFNCLNQATWGSNVFNILIRHTTYFFHTSRLLTGC